VNTKFIINEEKTMRSAGQFRQENMKKNEQERSQEELLDDRAKNMADMIKTAAINIFDQGIIIAEQFRQDSLQEGMEKGRAEGKTEALKTVAVNLFNQGTAIDKIAVLTGLSVRELEQLNNKTIN